MIGLVLILNFLFSYIQAGFKMCGFTALARIVSQWESGLWLSEDLGGARFQKDAQTGRRECLRGFEEINCLLAVRLMLCLEYTIHV